MRIITLLLAALSFGAAFCQPAINNSSFENWSLNNGLLEPDYWSADSAELAGGAVKKSTQATDGTTGLYLGSYMDGSKVYGSAVEQMDTLSGPVYGLNFDYIVQNNTSKASNGLALQIIFFDGQQNYLTSVLWTSGTFVNNAAFKKMDLKFSSPDSARYYLISFSYINLSGSATEYSIIDNVRFDKKQSTGLSATDNPLDFKVYPNPAGSWFRIDNADLVHEVEIDDLAGKMVESFPGGNAGVDISGLKAGLYFVRLKGLDGELLATRRLEVVR